MTASTPSQNLQSLPLGIIFALVAAAANASMSASVKALSGELPTTTIVFFRFLFSFSCVLPWVIRDPNFSFKVTNPWRYGVRITAALGAITCTFAAVQIAPLTSVLLLGSTTPLFIPVLAAILLKTKTHISVWTGIGIGFMGVGIVLHPNAAFFQNAGELLALAAGFLAAIAILQLRILSKNHAPLQLLFYYYGVSAIVMGLISSLNWRWPTTPRDWLVLTGVGLFSTIFQVCATFSIVRAPSRIITPLSFTRVVWGGILDYFIWGIAPDITTAIGFSVVVVGIVMVIYFGQRHIMPAPQSSSPHSVAVQDSTQPDETQASSANQP
ncbi:MAG: DMT family transporter [Cyanobacteria bacterium P01_H01_bin.121]